MSNSSCPRLIKSTDISIVNGLLQITIPDFTFENMNKYFLVLCQTIPELATTEIVILKSCSSCYNLVLSKYGNLVRADQLRTRFRYEIIYGNDPVHISVMNCLFPTEYVLPIVSKDNEETGGA